MDDHKRDTEKENSMDFPIWGTEDISDDELLREFEAVKHMTVPLPVPGPQPDEFEKIWKQIQKERDMGAEKEDISEKRPGLLRRIFRFPKRGK